MKIEDIRHEKLREILHRENWSDEDADEFADELFNSTLIAGYVENEGFVLIWDSNNKPHLPLFTDIEEFEKIFADYSEDISPQAYRFSDLVSVAKEDLVINPASESLVLNPEMFKV